MSVNAGCASICLRSVGVACRSELCASRACRSLRPRKGLLGCRAGSFSLLGVHCRAWCLRQNGNRFKSETCCQLDAQKKATKLELELIRPSNNDNRSASDRASLALADKQYGSSISKHSSGSSGHNIHYHSHRLSVPGQFVWHSAIW